MEKVTNKVKNFLGENQELLKRYPITFLGVLFLTLYCLIVCNSSVLQISKFWYIVEGAIFAILGIFLVEIIIKKERPNASKKKWIGISIASAVGCLIGIVSYQRYGIAQGTISRWALAYFLILGCFILYQIQKQHAISFCKYLTKVFSNLFIVGIGYGVLNIGLMILATIASVLLISNGIIMSMLYKSIQILLLGLFLVPFSIKAITMDANKPCGTITKVFVQYILIPMVVISFVIIYLYMAKIFIMQQIPSNVISRILIAIFMVGFPIWNMAASYQEENKWMEWIARILPWIYLPFIGLEVYAITTRTVEFGLTASRYLVYMFIVFQTICLLLNIVKKGSRLDKIYWVAILMIAITFVSPFHYAKVGNLAQKHQIESSMQDKEFDQLTQEEKKKVSGAYQYLKKQVGKEAGVEEYLDTISQDNQKKMQSFYYRNQPIPNGKSSGNSFLYNHETKLESRWISNNERGRKCK